MSLLSLPGAESEGQLRLLVGDGMSRSGALPRVPDDEVAAVTPRAAQHQSTAGQNYYQNNDRMHVELN